MKTYFVIYLFYRKVTRKSVNYYRLSVESFGDKSFVSKSLYVTQNNYFCSQSPCSQDKSFYEQLVSYSSYILKVLKIKLYISQSTIFLSKQCSWSHNISGVLT